MWKDEAGQHMTESALASAVTVASRDLAQLQHQIDKARGVLRDLQRDVEAAGSQLDATAAAQLLEANEQLTLAALRAQSEAESAVQESAFRELTVERRLEAQSLSEENRQIQETGRLKSQFLANMSHELRTPLNAVIGLGELLESGAIPPGSPKQLEFLGHITASGRLLLDLVDEVLDLTQVEAGKLDFYPEPVNLTQAVEEVIEVHRGAVSRHRLSIDVEVEPGLCDLVLDPKRLRQVLSNYLSNAIKFTPAGGRISVRAFADADESLRVEVEDTGIGIAPAELRRLFIEFQQLDNSNTRTHQGAGLGLALTRLLVEAQGGSVGVRSTPGVGSVFHFVLKRHGFAGVSATGSQMPIHSPALAHSRQAASTGVAVSPRTNQLLAALPAVEWRRWLPQLESVEMPLGQVLYEPGGRVAHVYFPTTAIVSLLHVMEDGAAAEIAVVGNEGVVGISLFMGGASTPSRAMVRSAGQGFRLSARAIKAEFQHAPVAQLLLRYTQALITQMAQTAACNRHHSLDKQLCRWLLLSIDRMNGCELVMTQELIANMLGVRREGVTHSASKLQEAGLIRYSRGRISIIDRVGLEKRTCECYAVVKREYDRLLPA